MRICLGLGCLDGMSRYSFYRFVTLLALVASVLFLSVHASAFINIETVRKEKGEGFFGRSALRVAGQKGNTNKFTGNVSSLNIERGERDELLMLLNFVYSETFGVKDTNNGQAHLRYVFNAQERYAYEFFTQIEFDKFKDLNDRTLFGATIRQRLFRDEQDSFYLGYGGFYEMEHYEDNVHRFSQRGNVYLSFVKKLFERVSATATGYYQPSVRKLEDYRIRFEGGMNVEISSRLALELTYTLAHDNQLPVDVVKTDMTYLTGISIKY